MVTENSWEEGSRDAPPVQGWAERRGSAGELVTGDPRATFHRAQRCHSLVVALLTTPSLRPDTAG